MLSKTNFLCFVPLFILMLALDLSAGTKIPVFVSILPQKDFVQRIGGDKVMVQVMVRPGASPATYEPKPSQMANLSRAKLYFSIGVPFEETWLPKIAAANPGIKIVKTDRKIGKIAMAAHDHEEDDGEDSHKEEEKVNGRPDPHIWLSPPLVKIQALEILNALLEADPSHRDDYQAGFKAFSADIDFLDNHLKNTFKERPGDSFMVFHPSWGYFADAYGLKQIPIEVEGKSPKLSQLRNLIKQARQKNIKVIFAQPQFSSKSAKLLAREIKGQVIFADPLSEDWIFNLNQVAEKFRKALR
jgi:zinc transport system substrate-binding protein